MDASRYEILYDLTEGEYSQAEVGGIRTRTIRAGNTIEVECYPLIRVGARAREEVIRRRHQREAQERLNRRNAEKRIRRLTEHNFTPEDWFVTLTWDYGAIDRFRMSAEDADRLHFRLGLPVDEEDAHNAWTNFLRRNKTRMRQRGEDPGELKYIYVLEITKPKVGGFHHYHFHAVIHAPGLTDADLRELWPHGFTRCDRLSWADEGPARLGHYLTKAHTTEELGTNGRRRRRWNHSKNLAEPVETVSDRKISRRRAARIAADVMNDGRAIFEAVYPGYRCVESPTVRYSDFVAGAYIFARLRKVDASPPWERGKQGVGARIRAQQAAPLRAPDERGRDRGA